MDRTNSRIAQAYGYAVCFITVIVMLIAIKSVVDAAIDLSDPIRAEGGGYGRMGRPVTSFEMYKVEARRQPNPRTDGRPSSVTIAADGTSLTRDRVTADTLSDAELRRLYDAERADVIASAHFRAMRSLIGNLLLLVLAAVLFGVHWRWLKQRDAVQGPA
jgi:hypothetical protein